jgi:hypothetical protein
MDHLSLVKTVDGFGQGVVVAVADTAHRGLDASFGQTWVRGRWAYLAVRGRAKSLI